MDKFTLTKQQMKVKDILQQVIDRKMRKKAGAEALNLSISGFYKKVQKYIDCGDESLIHGNKNKESKRKMSNETHAKILALQAENQDSRGPTFLAKKMKELYNISISHETVRNILIINKCWKPRRLKPKH